MHHLPLSAGLLLTQTAGPMHKVFKSLARASLCYLLLFPVLGLFCGFIRPCDVAKKIEARKMKLAMPEASATALRVIRLTKVNGSEK